MGERLVRAHRPGDITFTGEAARAVTFAAGPGGQVLVEHVRRRGMSAAFVQALQQVFAELETAVEDYQASRAGTFSSESGKAVEAEIQTWSPAETQIGTTEAAQMIGRTRQRVGQLLRDGKIPAVRGPGGYLIERADVLAYIERHRSEAA